MRIQYKLQNNPKGEVNGITIVGQAISIPFDPANTDYQEYLKWVADGGVPLPPDSQE